MCRKKVRRIGFIKEVKIYPDLARDCPTVVESPDYSESLTDRWVIPERFHILLVPLLPLGLECLYSLGLRLG